MLAPLAVALPLSAGPVVGDAGATVAGVLLGAVLLAGAAAVWPWTPSAAEAEHRWLEAIWRAARTDARERVPWDRYLSWAEPDGEAVSLQLLRCAAADAKQPSPYSRSERRRLDSEDVAGAVEAMESLRAQAAELELRAAQRHEELESRRDQHAHEDRLAAIDRATDEEIRQRTERDRRELAAQDAAERRAQAEALARSLRRG